MTPLMMGRPSQPRPVQLVSLGATNLVDTEEHQLNLFDSVPVKPQGELNDAPD